MIEEQNQLPMQCDLISVLDQADESLIREKWPKKLVEYVDVLISQYQRDGMKPEVARRTAYSGITALAHFRGGKNDYIPTGELLTRAIQHMEIWQAFYNNEKDVEQLAEAHKMNEISIYAILKEQRQLHSKKIQPDMFATEDA